MLTKQSILLTLYSAVAAGARTHFHSYFIPAFVFLLQISTAAVDIPDPLLLGFIISLKYII